MYSSTRPHLADYIHETRRIFLSPFVSKASSFFRRVQLSQRYVATGHIRSVDHRRSAWASWNHRVLQLGVSTATVSLTTAWSGARPRFSACRWMSSSSVRTVHCRLYSECVGGVDRAASRVVVRITALVVSVCLCVCVRRNAQSPWCISDCLSLLLGCILWEFGLLLPMFSGLCVCQLLRLWALRNNWTDWSE